MKNYLLLIWQLVPEDLEMYLIPMPEIETDISYFHKINHKLVNIINTPDEDDALAFVSEWLEDNKEYQVSKNAVLMLTDSQKIQTVITSGFLL